jgi:hypothetical protein
MSFENFSVDEHKNIPDFISSLDSENTGNIHGTDFCIGRVFW